VNRIAAARLVASLVALAWTAPSTADEGAMRLALRAEVGAATGWSGRGALASEARLALRLGPLIGGLTVDAAGAPSKRDPFLQAQGSLGAGLVREVGEWEASGMAFLSVNNVRYPDLLGTGPTYFLTPGVGLRGGLGRYFGGRERPGKLVPWLGFSATVGVARSTRLRVQEQRHPGFVALLSVTVGAGVSLRRAFFNPDANPP
jgi:hypothetical protein